MSTLSVFTYISLNKHMKKIAVLGAMAMCVLVLAGCNKKADPQQPAPSNPQANTQTPEPAENPAAEQGDLIKVFYIGRSEEAGLFDTNVESVAQEEGIYNEQRPYEPLEFVIGAGMMIPGMETGVIGMNVGETKTISIEPGEAYGEYREELIQELPKDNFATAGIEPVVGETYNFGIAQGKVLGINDETVTMDFNHQLAGQQLNFEVTVEEIVKASQLEAQEEALAG